MSTIRRAMAALLFGLLLLTGPELAVADEASPEQPLEEVAVEDVDEPLEATVDEADPLEANSGGTVNVYRLYNRKTSEHLYTTSLTEYDTLAFSSNGTWRREGVAWVAPKKSSTPVYRLYNKGLGDHHYTTSKGERDALTRKGWRYEGIAFYSDDAKRVPLYRVYNGRLKAGQHHYTTSKGERDSLVKKSGWRNEGIGWYAVKKGSNAGVTVDAACTIPAGTYKGWAYEEEMSGRVIHYDYNLETLIIRRDGSYEWNTGGPDPHIMRGYIGGPNGNVLIDREEYDYIELYYHGGSKPYIDCVTLAGFGGVIFYRQ